MRGGVFLQFAAEVPKLIVDQVFAFRKPRESAACPHRSFPPRPLTAMTAAHAEPRIWERSAGVRNVAPWFRRASAAAVDLVPSVDFTGTGATGQGEQGTAPLPPCFWHTALRFSELAAAVDGGTEGNGRQKVRLAMDALAGALQNDAEWFVKTMQLHFDKQLASMRQDWVNAECARLSKENGKRGFAGAVGDARRLKQKMIDQKILGDDPCWQETMQPLLSEEAEHGLELMSLEELEKLLCDENISDLLNDA